MRAGHRIEAIDGKKTDEATCFRLSTTALRGGATTVTSNKCGFRFLTSAVLITSARQLKALFLAFRPGCF